MKIGKIEIRGLDVDDKTRCKHYHSEVDIIAIKFPCCRTYYPCYQCHEAVAGHPPSIWPTEQFDEKAVLCGACGNELTVRQYLTTNSVCPFCSSHFNSGCGKHHELYFDRKGFESQEEKKGAYHE